MNTTIQARNATLTKLSKKEVFAIYVSTCLGRINSANAAELRKSWMVYDILVAQFGRKAVEAAL